MTIMSLYSSSLTFGQHYKSQVWSPDLGNGKLLKIREFGPELVYVLNDAIINVLINDIFQLMITMSQLKEKFR